jgi:hypothetical protein
MTRETADVEQLLRQLETMSLSGREAIAAGPDLPLAVVERLARDERSDVRRVIARRAGLPPALVDALAGDVDDDVRSALAERPEERLLQLMADGLTFGDCVRAFSTRLSTQDKTYGVYAATRLHHAGEIEVDETPMVHRCGNPHAGGGRGAYVLTWTWVDDDDVDDFEGGTDWRAIEPSPGM